MWWTKYGILSIRHDNVRYNSMFILAVSLICESLMTERRPIYYKPNYSTAISTHAKSL